MTWARRGLPAFALEDKPLACRACGAMAGQMPCGEERSLGIGQELFLCMHCGLAYLTPDFTDAALSVFYRDHYRHVSLVDAARRHDARFFKRKLNREFAAKRVALIASQLPMGARVLEIGSGFGAFIGQLHRVRPDVVFYATEEDVAHRDLLLDGASVQFITHVEIVEQAPFNLIIALHVVEHLKRPIEDMRLFARMLTPSGRLVVEVPDIFADWGNWLYVQPAHVSYFSAASLKRAMMRAGVALDTLGDHPAGAVLAGNLWAVGRRSEETVEVEDATAEEITALHAHIVRYAWHAKPALRKWLRDMVIALGGAHMAGAMARRRYYRRHAHYFAS